MKPRLKVLFVPDWSKGNPYQNLLISHLKENGVDVVLDNYPPQWFALLKLVKRHPECRIIHIHWIDRYIDKLFWSSSKLKILTKLCLCGLDMLLIKILGRKIVWTVHNKYTHESPNQVLERMFRRLLACFSNRIIIHSPASRDEILREYRLKHPGKIIVIPHGHFIDFYPNRVGREEARRKLGLSMNDKVVLFLGMIRSYKGVEQLIEAFNELDYANDYRLLLAGSVISSEFTGRLRHLIKNDKTISVFRSIADEEIQVFMNAGDVCVFPFHDVLTSGSVILAMSFARAVIAPRKGSLADLLDDSGAVFLEDGKSLKDTIVNVFQKDLEQMGWHNQRVVSTYTWQSAGKSLGTAYYEILK